MLSLIRAFIILETVTLVIGLLHSHKTIGLNLRQEGSTKLFLQNKNCKDFLQNKNCKDFLNTKLIACSLIPIFSMFGLPSFGYANPSNPDAIEIRRVMEQPEIVSSMTEPIKSKVVVLPSGVQYFDVKEGEGKQAEEGNSVQFQWVLRRSNGYFVDASSNYGNEPFIYRVGNTKKVIKGLDEAIRGMRAGGVRRINIPPQVGFTGVGDEFPGPMPSDFGPRRQILSRIDKEVWYFEIQLIKVK
jgi:hypothetical protein